MKNLIVIHGTGSGNIQSVLDTYKANPSITTQYIIGRLGEVIEYKPAESICWHAGKNFRELSVRSIGIELVNWNWLTKRQDKFYSWTNKEVPVSEVVDLKASWRGYQYFQCISTCQFNALTLLLKQLTETYHIPKSMHRKFTKDIKSLNGICLHSTFHPEKLDFPPNLIPPIKI